VLIRHRSKPKGSGQWGRAGLTDTAQRLVPGGGRRLGRAIHPSGDTQRRSSEGARVSPCRYGAPLSSISPSAAPSAQKGPEGPFARPPLTDCLQDGQISSTNDGAIGWRCRNRLSAHRDTRCLVDERTSCRGSSTVSVTRRRASVATVPRSRSRADRHNVAAAVGIYEQPRDRRHMVPVICLFETTLRLRIVPWRVHPLSLRGDPTSWS
jgi:hypothetical protein